MTEPLNFVASIHKTEKKIDGSIRLILDLGLDAFEAVQEMERAGMIRGEQFAFAAVPYDEFKAQSLQELTPLQDSRNK